MPGELMRRSQDKAKFDEKTEFIPINEYFEENFNAVLASALVLQQPARRRQSQVQTP